MTEHEIVQFITAHMAVPNTSALGRPLRNRTYFCALASALNDWAQHWNEEFVVDCEVSAPTTKVAPATLILSDGAQTRALALSFSEKLLRIDADDGEESVTYLACEASMVLPIAKLVNSFFSVEAPT